MSEPRDRLPHGAAALPGGVDASAPIGLFDSGLGGLSVWREIVRQLPAESTIYLADRAHVPYGDRQPQQIRRYCEAICGSLVEAGCKAIIVACNTASAVALHHLRECFPGTVLLGLEPAVKPAVARTHSGVVGVMATPATFQGRLFRATVGRHAASVQVVEQVCLGLADRVEAGELEGPATEQLLEGFLAPMLAAGADTIVLGCTHYPFVIETIRRLVGPSVQVIDPAPAVARHLGSLLHHYGLEAPAGRIGEHRFFSTDAAERFDRDARRLIGIDAGSVSLPWDAGGERLQGCAFQPRHPPPEPF
ncbi:MAG: glutamate racemase [Vulcanococcus sp.]